jgi:hypothetical protein
MLTSLFRKSTPLNYGLVVIAATIFYFVYQIRHSGGHSTAGTIALLVIFLMSLFITNFVVKKNSISRDSVYTILFYLLFTLCFPALFGRPNLLLANLCLILAIRRLVSMHSFKATKEKIFDASFWICLAALFHFWCILFLGLVFISILFHVSRDYRNWVLPFLAIFCVGSAFMLYALVFDPARVDFLVSRAHYSLSVDYFTDPHQRIALSVYASLAVLFLFWMIATLSNRPLMTQSAYKKIVASFAIAAVIYVISPQKSNELLVFTIAPLSIMATAAVEYKQDRLRENLTVLLVMACGIFLFFYQL